jgi:hypothetical protein
MGTADAAGRQSMISGDEPVTAVGDVDAGGIILDVGPCEALKPDI